MRYTTTDPITGLRRCSRCGELLDLSAFGRFPNGWVRSRCRPCAVAETADWQRAHRAERLARLRRRYADFRAAGLSPAEARLRR